MQGINPFYSQNTLGRPRRPLALCFLPQMGQRYRWVPDAVLMVGIFDRGIKGLAAISGAKQHGSVISAVVSIPCLTSGFPFVHMSC